MDNATVKAKMLAQVNEARESALSRAFGWSFEIEGLICYVQMRPRKKPQDRSLLKIEFEEFPKHAPSYVFVDPETKEVTPDAWPPGVKHTANPPGICVHGTRECHEHYHANQSQYAYDPRTHTVLATLAEINRLLEKGVGNA